MSYIYKEDLDGINIEIDRGDVTIYGSSIEAYGGHCYQQNVTLDDKQMMRLIAAWTKQKVEDEH